MSVKLSSVVEVETYMSNYIQNKTAVLITYLCSFLQIWIDLNPSMDKLSHTK